MPQEYMAASKSANGDPSTELGPGADPQTVLAPPFPALLLTSAGGGPVDLPASPEPGERIGDFTIIKELGRGGMGVVYLARQETLNRQVALKMILAGVHADATALARFKTEAEAVARLQHPNIVQIFEVGEHDGRPFLALEYVPGGCLEEMVAETAQPEQYAARLVETLARAVHHTHRRGILHRDLKPSNVLLAEDGTPKITDFGLAKLLDRAGGPTRTEMLIGTPEFMSPEQAAGDTKKIGVPADVYALGAILYECLTGRAPFRGTTLLNTLEQVRTQEPVPPRSLHGPVSRDLETICLKCLEKEPARRYASAEALADDLRRFLGGESIRARPVPAWQRLWRSARRHPARVAGAAALLAVLLAAGWYRHVADQLAGRRAEEQYQQFVQHRDEALFYGLLAPDEGAMFVGAEAAANLQTAESTAREALALAGMEPDPAAPADPPFPAPRKAGTAADCYTLLLVLASVHARQPPAGAGDNERYHEALRILDRAPALGLETRAYHLRRADLLERAGRPGEARRERDRAAALPLRDALDHFLIGEEHYRRGDWEEARASFDRALTLQPGHFWAQFFLAVCHLKSQQWAAAKAGLNACLARQPDFVWAYLFRSFANEQLRALPEAETDFRRALGLNPNEDARYVLYLTRGILHFNQKERGRAEADFRAALALKPDQYNAYLNLAHVHLARGQFGPASERFEQALRLRPPSSVVYGYHLERGRGLMRERKFDEALRACDAALAAAPGQSPALVVRARALLALGRYEQAEAAVDQYLRSGGSPVPDVFRDRGQARMRLGKYPEAAEDYTRALERSPGGDLYQHRGWAHFFADAWKLALRDFDKAIELSPDGGDAYTGRGLARVRLGDVRGAVADAETALLRKPGTPEMMHNIACIFAQAAARAGTDSEDYRCRALEAVRRTLAMLPPAERPAFWRDKVFPERDLAPLQNDEGFRRLQQEYERPGGQGRSFGIFGKVHPSGSVSPGSELPLPVARRSGATGDVVV